MKNPSIKEKTDFTIKMIQKRKKKKLKEKNDIIYDVVDRAVRRCRKK